MICLLCRENEANQTGAHIITNSLVKNCLNVEGKTGRDDELIFTLTGSATRDIYVGNTTPLNKIEEVYGRPMTDEELEHNKNKIVVDNIYCRNCEKLFGKIESPFTAKILSKIRNNKILKFSSNDNLLIRLYFYIQIWRASSYKFEGWNLNNEELEEQLRILILNTCNMYDEGITEELQREIVNFPLVINYLETPEGKKSSNLFFIAKETTPFYFFFCDFIVEFLPFNQDPAIHKMTNYFGINYNLQQIEVNYKEDDFIIRHIPNERRKEINGLIFSEFGRIESEKLKDKCIETFKLQTGKEITQEELFLFRDIFFKDFENIPIAEKWSDERFDKILQSIIEQNK